NANIDDLLDAIDISRCPATEKNDCDDFIYLPIIPYADISLIETWLSLQAEEKMKTRVFRKPRDAANALMNIFGHKRTGD
ncbi:unnamed protein product, partial [marine sediment metagenome]